MGKMTVYHGSYTTVEKPKIISGRNTKDFGPGFYCTVISEQFWVLAKFKYPTHQINFCSPDTLKCLEFVSSEKDKKQTLRCRERAGKSQPVQNIRTS